MKRRGNEDDFEDQGYDKHLGYTVETLSAHIFKVNITTEFLGPDFYTDIFEMLVNAGPMDTVRFLVSSPGGRLDGLIMLLEGIRLTEARTEVVLAGSAYSAASLLCMAVDDVIVLPTADMLCHCMRYGSGGKAPDVLSNVEHSQKISTKIFKDYYEGFLNPEEMQKVMDGKELYLDADQITARFAARDLYFEEQLKKEGIDIEANEHTETQPDLEVQPKKRRNKSTKK